MLLFSELKKRNLLSNESMSNVRGGQWGGTCGYETADGHHNCGVSKRDALFMVESGGGHWCCDSCYKTSYCSNAIRSETIIPEY